MKGTDVGAVARHYMREILDEIARHQDLIADLQMKKVGLQEFLMRLKEAAEHETSDVASGRQASQESPPEFSSGDGPTPESDSGTGASSPGGDGSTGGNAGQD